MPQDAPVDAPDVRSPVVDEVDAGAVVELAIVVDPDVGSAVVLPDVPVDPADVLEVDSGSTPDVVTCPPEEDDALVSSAGPWGPQAHTRRMTTVAAFMWVGGYHAAPAGGGEGLCGRVPLA